VRIAPFFLLAVAAAAPAVAQDGSEGVTLRSPENAQKFLQVAASRFGLFMEGQRSLTSGRFAGYKLRYGDLLPLHSPPHPAGSPRTHAWRWRI
jgi:hypothetical protein